MSSEIIAERIFCASVVVYQRHQYREAGANAIARSQGGAKSYAATQNAAPERRVMESE
jgi:hypothetical protein